MPINLVTCAAVNLCCDWLLSGQLNHVELCVWGRVLLHPSHTSVQTPFIHRSPLQMRYHLFRSIQTKSPNIGFVLSTSLFNNPPVFTRFFNSVSDRYAIVNCRVSVLIIPMKRSPCFHKYSAVCNDENYESAQTILYVLYHGITISFSTFVPWGRLSLPYFWSPSLFADFTILIRIITPDRPHA